MTNDAFKIGTVTEFFSDGCAKVRFNGETTTSQKEYAYLDSYVPATGDKVLLGAINGTYVILGAIKYKSAPGEYTEYVSKTEFEEYKETVSTTLDEKAPTNHAHDRIYGNMTSGVTYLQGSGSDLSPTNGVNWTLGWKAAFSAMYSKKFYLSGSKSIKSLSSSSTLANAISKINEIITALDSAGLIN